MTSEKSAEDVLFAFSVEPRHDSETLGRYLKNYPELAVDLLDLSHELRISASLGPADVLAQDEASFEAAWQQFSSVARQGVPSASVGICSIDLTEEHLSRWRKRCLFRGLFLLRCGTGWSCHRPYLKALSGASRRLPVPRWMRFNSTSPCLQSLRRQ